MDYTALDLAVAKGQTKMAKMLLSYGANIYHVNYRGLTIYQRANEDMIKALNLKSIEDLISENNLNEIMKIYRINITKVESTSENDCPICFDQATCKTECEHHYCLECYLCTCISEKCIYCNKQLTKKLFVY